jgi:hypothetical protein
LKTTKPLEAVHAEVRKVVKYWDKDRFMAPDIESVGKLLEDEVVWKACAPYVDPRFHEFLPSLPTPHDYFDAESKEL